MSIEFSDSQVEQIVNLLSEQRLAALVRITGNDRDAVRLHQQMMLIGAAIMPITGLFEISLRNAVCTELREMFGTSDWLNNPPPPFIWRGEELKSLKVAIRHARRAEYSKMAHSEKKALDIKAFPLGVPNGESHEQRSKERQKAIEVSEGQQIAQLTILFWKRLFSSDYHSTLWKRSLKKIFPNKALSRADVAVQLEVIYQARNRIAHHEPLYGSRLNQVMESIDFVALNFRQKQPSPDAILYKMIQLQRASLHFEAQKLDKMLAMFPTFQRLDI
jgi:hypothetical protein